MHLQYELLLRVLTFFIPHKVFADLVDVKIEKHQLNDLVMKGDEPAARGAFGAVFNRTLRTKVHVHVLSSCVWRGGTGRNLILPNNLLCIDQTTSISLFLKK